MKFVGSKNRISKQIAPIIQSLIDSSGATIYYEPFLGGANMMDKIHCEHRYGNDIHKELIALHRKMQEGWQPPKTITEEEYNRVREHREDYPDYYVGLVGFCATFGSKYFGGYARGFKNDGVTPRDIPAEAIRNLCEQAPLLRDVELSCADYQSIEPYGAVVYADPPYRNTTKFATGDFDYERFYDWCRKISQTNILLVSEYYMPDDFRCIWQKPVTTSLKVYKHEDRIERLFVHNAQKLPENFE